MLLLGRRIGHPAGDLAGVLKGEACLQSFVTSPEGVDLLPSVTEGLSRASHLLGRCPPVEGPRADPWRGSGETQTGGDCLLQELDLEMTSSVDANDRKMPVPSIGGLQPEEEPVGLLSEEDLAPH